MAPAAARRSAWRCAPPPTGRWLGACRLAYSSRCAACESTLLLTHEIHMPCTASTQEALVACMHARRCSTVDLSRSVSVAPGSLPHCPLLSLPGLPFERPPVPARAGRPRRSPQAAGGAAPEKRQGEMQRQARGPRAGWARCAGPTGGTCSLRGTHGAPGHGSQPTTHTVLSIEHHPCA